MFAEPSKILKVTKGTLSEVPLPLLFRAVLVSKRTCGLELKRQASEKTVIFEDGLPVACTTNVVGETIGKFLTEKKVLTEEQYQKLLAASARSGVKLEELVVQKGILDATTLGKHLQANLAHRILNCFRWVDARYHLVQDVDIPDRTKVNSLQLIFTGVSLFLPYDLVGSQFPHTKAQRFARVHTPPHGTEELKLSEKEQRLLELLGNRPSVEELLQQAGLEEEELIRRLYALAVLGIIDLSEHVPASPPVRALASGAEPAPQGAPSPAGAAVLSPAQGETTASTVPLQGAASPQAASSMSYLAPGRVDGELAPGIIDPRSMAGRASDQALEELAGYEGTMEQRRRRALYVGVSLLGTGLLVAGLLLARTPAPSAPAPESAPAMPPPRPKKAPLPRPAPSFTAAPAGALAQPMKPRNLSLSASGIKLELPAVKPGTPEAAGMDAGLRLLRAGAAEKALVPLNKVVERSPENADALYAAALCLYELGKDDDVRPLLDRALKADPKHPGGHLLAGFLEQQAARLKAARVHYTRFLEAAPGAEQAADVKSLLEQLPESAP